MAANAPGSTEKLSFENRPRIARMRPGQTRFTLTDPSGTSVIFIKLGPEDEGKELGAGREA